METSFFAHLETVARETNSLLCVGLDPHPADLPAPTPAAARDFCLRLMEATYGLAAAYKPNSAFFEAFGPQGMSALEEVIAAAPPGIPVILDAKRGDIASTAEAYSLAVFNTLKAHAVTLSPYLGYDSLTPFLSDPARGVFLLCKTSNPGAADLQDLPLASGERLFEAVARLAQQWNQKNNLGLVAGATHLEALARIRSIAPDLWLLSPGVGAQGGNLQAALEAGLRSDGLGMLIPVSRGISRAPNPRKAAEELRQAINAIREKGTGHSHSASKLVRDREGPVGQESLAETPPEKKNVTPDRDFRSLAESLLESGCVRFGTFTLKSGLVSPIYIDLRQLASFPSLLEQAAEAYLSLLEQLDYDRLAALPYAALPITTAISLELGCPMVYPRKEVKAYGTRAEIEGLYEPGEKVVVIDDLATTGGSKFEGIEKLTNAGLQVSDVVVLIDRQSGAAEALAEAGYHLHAVFTLSELLAHWQESGKVPVDQIEAARDFISRSAMEP